MLHAYKWWNQISKCSDLADTISYIAKRQPEDVDLLDKLRDELLRLMPIRFVRMLAECSDEDLCSIMQWRSPNLVTQEVRLAARRWVERDRSRAREVFDFMLDFQRNYFIRQEEQFARACGR